MAPTYDYHCDACDHQFEHFQNIRDKPLARCPNCDQYQLRRLIGGGAAVIFRGNGFYCNDYKSKHSRKAEKGEKSED
jgi:putative FmdB family regulatory protein